MSDKERHGGRQVVVCWKRRCTPRTKEKIRWRFLIHYESVNGESVAWVDDENRADFEATVRAGFLEVRHKPVSSPFIRRVDEKESSNG